MSLFRNFRNNYIASESGKVPSRLTANGNGEVKCVILTDSFEKAKQGLMPYASCIVKNYPFISAFGAQVNVHTVRDLERLPFVKAIGYGLVRRGRGSGDYRYGRKRAP